MTSVPTDLITRSDDKSHYRTSFRDALKYHKPTGYDQYWHIVLEEFRGKELKEEKVRHALTKFWQLQSTWGGDMNNVNDDRGEIIRIKTAKNLTITEKKALLNARIGQGQFRKLLIDEWGGCAVMDCKVRELLRASHIKPWRVSIYVSPTFSLRRPRRENRPYHSKSIAGLYSGRVRFCDGCCYANNRERTAVFRSGS